MQSHLQSTAYQQISIMSLVACHSCSLPVFDVLAGAGGTVASHTGVGTYGLVGGDGGGVRAEVLREDGDEFAPEG